MHDTRSHKNLNNVNIRKVKNTYLFLHPLVSFSHTIFNNISIKFNNYLHNFYFTHTS